jgi:hypothetical protein
MVSPFIQVSINSKTDGTSFITTGHICRMANPEVIAAEVSALSIFTFEETEQLNL